MLNHSQRLFFEATVRGEKPEQAAISAGMKSPKAAGFRMRKHPKVVAALAAVGISTDGAVAAPVPPKSTNAEGAPHIPGVTPPDIPKTDDSLVFLEALMNDVNASVKDRLEAAKALAPFQHAKVGEKGKKETKADAAKELAAGQKFGARKAPPKLQSVN